MKASAGDATSPGSQVQNAGSIEAPLEPTKIACEAEDEAMGDEEAVCVRALPLRSYVPSPDKATGLHEAQSDAPSPTKVVRGTNIESLLRIVRNTPEESEPASKRRRMDDHTEALMSARVLPGSAFSPATRARSVLVADRLSKIEPLEMAEGLSVRAPLAPPIKTRFLEFGDPPPRSLIKPGEDQPRQQQPKTERRTILVVDDSYVVRRFLKRTFDQHGYEVDVAQNGWHAFAAMQSRVYDFVFLDIEMPVMNGFRCIEAIRKWEARVHRRERQFICALTSHTAPHEREIGKALGANRFEAKPTRPSRLLDIVALTVAANDKDAVLERIPEVYEDQPVQSANSTKSSALLAKPALSPSPSSS